VRAIDEFGELKQVQNVDANEIGAITSISSTLKPIPAILFDRIAGYKPGCRVLVNLLASRNRCSLIEGISEKTEGLDLVKEWKHKLAEYVPTPPQKVENGPVKENIFTEKEADVRILPCIKWHPEDFSSYWSYAAVVMKDLETGYVNIGMYRVSVYDKQTLGMHIAIGHDGQIIRDRWWKAGKAAPVAICLGTDPWVADVSTTDLGFGESEYDYAGWLRGKAIEVVEGETTGLPIPATAEAVIEGEIPTPEDEPFREEGPWGEADGYYCRSFPGPVVKVKCICHRDDPIILGTSNGVPPQRSYIGSPTDRHRAAAVAWIKLEKLGLPGVHGIGFVSPFLVCSITQLYPGHVKRVADALMAGLTGSRPPTHLMLVDDDIDPWNTQDVLWAMRTRCEPAEQIRIEKKVYTSVVNPWVWTPEMRKVPLEKGATGSSLIVDACRPYHWKDEFNEVIGDIEPVLKKHVKDKWEQVMGWPNE
jgi:4-hydroxy-3-polyprenylbenzoate decarboxylase